MSQSGSEHSVAEQNIVSQSDIDLVSQSLNIFGRSSQSVSQPSLAIGSTIVPQRFANLGNVQQQPGLSRTSHQRQTSTLQSQGQRVQQQTGSNPQQSMSAGQQQQQPGTAMSQPSVQIQLKIPEPKPYTGDRRNARTWLSGLNRYFAACGWSTQQHDSQMLAVACALMHETASKWLDRLEKLNDYPNTYDEFMVAFVKQFSVLDDENTARDKLKEARQKTTVARYVQYFDSIVLELPSVQEEELVHAFCYGLKQPIKGQVKALLTGQSNVKLSDAMLLALQYEENLGKPGGDQSSARALAQKQRSAPRQHNGPVPMELGNMQANRYANVRCYNCQQFGHMARDCPKPKRQQKWQQRQQYANNIRVDEQQHTDGSRQLREAATATMPKNF